MRNRLFFCFVFWNLDGKEGKNKEASAVSSSSSSSAVKPKVKNTSSIAGIALCWQAVVQRQVIHKHSFIYYDHIHKVLHLFLNVCFFFCLQIKKKKFKSARLFNCDKIELVILLCAFCR